MDAFIRPGEVVVVLGRPGSGCTTLLKSIASNTHGFHISEESQISYRGLTPHEVKKNFRGEIVYNAESDIHFPHLTVGQTLLTAASSELRETESQASRENNTLRL
jgi:ATP-binding cassette subfamily G (WHITE) protein 2 (PDR)